MTDETLTAAYEALVAANEALVVTQPSTDKFYVLRNAYPAENGYCSDALAYADPANHTAKWNKSKETTDATAVWCFEQDGSNYYLRNLHTGTYLTKDPTTEPYKPRTLSETTKQPVTFVRLGGGVLNIMINGSPIHAQGSGNSLVIYAGDANSASAWRIEKAYATAVVHTRSISSYGYAGF